MTDNTKMVDLPWHDGTTRTVPEFTPYVTRSGVVLYARDGGYSYTGGADSCIHLHHESAAVRILTEAPEPPVKVDVPTGIGAIVSGRWAPDRPVFVLDRYGWRSLRADEQYGVSEIAEALRKGARVRIIREDVVVLEHPRRGIVQ